MRTFNRGNRVYFIANGPHDTGTIMYVRTDSVLGTRYRVRWDFANSLMENLDWYTAEDLELAQ